MEKLPLTAGKKKKTKKIRPTEDTVVTSNRKKSNYIKLEKMKKIDCGLKSKITELKETYSVLFA